MAKHHPVMAKRPKKSDFDFFAIDKYRLDEECEQQADLMFSHAFDLADAKRELEEASSDMDVTEAELARDIRTNPLAFGLPDKPPGVDIVEKTILLQPIYIQARDVWIRAKHTVDVLQAVCNALEHKKRSIEGLIQLHAMAYFGPKLSEEVHRAKGEMDRREAFTKKRTKGEEQFGRRTKGDRKRGE